MFMMTFDSEDSEGKAEITPLDRLTPASIGASVVKQDIQLAQLHARPE